MARITVTVDGVKEAQYAFSRFNVAAVDHVRREVNVAAIDVQRYAKQNCPVDTGRLRSSIGLQFFTGGLAAEVGTNVAYAAAVEFGSAPHLIVPRRARALAFMWRGKQMFLAHVHHPGTRARPFLFPAWERVRPRFVAALESFFRRGGK